MPGNKANNSKNAGRLLLWFLSALLLPLAVIGGELRGIWWWTSPDHAWGTEQVLGNPTKEGAVIQFLQSWNVGRVYCCFSDQTQTKPALIYAWNERVHAAGMTSQLLLSENTWIFLGNRSNLSSVHLQRELIDFNASAANSRQRFDGLHLDIEPHGLPEWKTMSPAGRKRLLLLLRDTFRDVRFYLDESGAKGIPIYADLPVWFDQIGNQVGWESAAERDGWFADISRSLAGISLMAYERNSAAKIESGVTWELQNFKGEVRVGLEASVGADKTWNTFDELSAMIQKQEDVGPSRKVDVHDFAQFYDVARTAAGTALPK